MNKSITVRQLVREKGKDLELKLIVGKSFLDREITVSEVNRPGLAVTGFLEQFRAERIQIIGKGEYYYCSSRPYSRIYKNLNRMFENNKVPCVIVTGGVKPAKALIDAAKKNSIPLFITPYETADFVRELTIYLDEKLAPSIVVHGVLVNVYGLGVLIQGDPGIGKSECAMELLKRGHILISDDVVEIKRRIGHILIGSSPKTIKNFMEVRGIGIVDVEMLFGVGAILPSSAIELVVYLQSATNIDLSKYDRTGLEEQTTKILDINVPILRIPVTPGRNLAVLIEVASLNQRLKNSGYFAAKKLDEAIRREIKKNSR
ncbi:MAG: HPr(Ser) kinase/phosphatase [Elusimicrobiales bacterium]|nr:HPr(Ser) kinase/phosphatase [Elusimicrobiales bacterium]